MFAKPKGIPTEKRDLLLGKGYSAAAFLYRSEENFCVFEQAFRNIDDVLRKEAGCTTDRGSANFAWVQHFIHHLAPHGMAGFVLAVTASLNHSFCISGS